ncbi:helicase SRCAP-like [Coregonus clupeaformis]|uniref:helicase SRCAP-like n=1 Tax=Coregonus clupeaformis TaxID=59861 RepID=UPI001E1C442C|nr:helicase SRCAP-like [Coregonus clupeaformis]
MACDGQYDNSEWPDLPTWPPAFDESLLPYHQSDTPSLQCGYQEPPPAAMSSLSPGAHILLSVGYSSTIGPAKRHTVPTCQLLDTPSMEYQPVDGARVCLPVPAIGFQFALCMGIQPVPDKVFQSAATKDPSVNRSLQPATVPELPPAPATEPKLINEVDSSAAPATEHQPVAATVVIQTNMVLQPSPATGALPTPVLEPRPATTDGAQSAPSPGLLLPSRAQPTPVKSDSLSAGHEEQPSPPTRAQPASVIVDPLPPTQAAQLDLKVQPGPVFRSPAPATESHRVAATGPQTAVDADHQPASPWLPPAAAQGSSAPVTVSLAPAAAQGPPPGFTLSVIPVSVRGASPEANDKPPPAPDEEPIPACEVHPGSVGEPQSASRREPSVALAQGPQSHPAWGALLPSLENTSVPAVRPQLSLIISSDLAPDPQFPLVWRSLPDPVGESPPEPEPFTLSTIELPPGPALGVKPAPANGAQSTPSFESQTVSAPETVYFTDTLLVAPTASDSQLLETC